MKKTALLFTIFLVYLPISYAQFFSDNCSGGKNILPIQDINLCNNSEWLLVFEDNFDGDNLDLTKWKGSNYPGSMIGGDHQNVVTLRNAVVENGILNLIAKPEHVQELVITWKDSSEILSDGLPNYRWFDYTAGLIKSTQKYGYGYFEASCKIPSGKGIWPAMWMYGDYFDQDSNKYEHEIDVFEFWEDKPNDLNMNVHYDGEACFSDYNGSDYSKDFHTYTLIWEPYKIDWYVDGKLIKHYPRYYQNGSDSGCRLNAWQPYHETPFPKGSMTLTFNIAVDNREGKKPDGSTVFPSKFQIDWIRYYKRQDLIDANKGYSIFSNVYPNPANKSVFIEVNEISTEEIYIRFLNSQALLIIEQALSALISEIDISNLENGVYFLQIINEKTKQVNHHKIIILK